MNTEPVEHPVEPPTEQLVDQLAERSPIARLLRGALTITLAVLAFRANTALCLTLVALMLTVAFHEWGHFLVARRLRLHTPEFAVGFGPVVYSRYDQRRDMVWSLRALPLGGYVRIAGMDGSGEDPHPTRRPWDTLSHGQRMLLAFAGPFANMVLSFFLVVGILVMAGTADKSLVRVNPIKGLPAASAGLQPLDVVTAINDAPVSSYDDLVAKVNTLDLSKPASVAVLRAGETRVLSITPKPSDSGPVLGVEFDPKTRTPSPTALVSNSANLTWELLRTSVSGLSQIADSAIAIPARLISPSSDTSTAPRLVSPIGAARLAEESSETAWYAPLALLASSSMFIGVFNLLPIPPLDGGHIAIAGWESVMSRIRKRRVTVDPATLAPFVRVVIAFVLLLGVSSVLLDIINPITP